MVDHQIFKTFKAAHYSWKKLATPALCTPSNKLYSICRHSNHVDLLNKIVLLTVFGVDDYVFLERPARDRCDDADDYHRSITN